MTFPRLNAKSERAQAMAELALVLPALCLILLAILQCGIVFKNYVTLTDAVRAGARKAAVSRHQPCPECVTENAVDQSASGLDKEYLQVEVTPAPWAPGTDVTVKASYPYEINLLGLVVKSGEMTSTTTERVE